MHSSHTLPCALRMWSHKRHGFTCLASATAVLVASLLATTPVNGYEAEPNDCLNEDVTGTLVASPTTVAMGGSTTLTWSVQIPGWCGGVTRSLTSDGDVPLGGVVSNNGTQVTAMDTNARSWFLRAKRNGVTKLLARVNLASDTTGYTTAGTPMCNSAQVARHDRIRNDQHSVDVIDPDGSYIGSSEGDGELWRNWEPVDQFKHALCGTQDRYSYYVGPWYGYAGAEADSNKFVVPSLPFRHLIEDAVNLGFTDSDAVSDCRGSRCMEAEITPDEADAGNPWFPHVDGASVLDRKPLCVYGPWIADHGHGGKAEIHPSEAHWWPTIPTPAGLLSESRVLLMHDDSNRFDERVDDFTPDMPAQIKPWSAAPRTAHVRHAFLVPQSGGSEQFLHVWNPSRFRHVTPTQADVTTGTRHTLKFNGTPRFTIVEQAGVLEQNLSVAFDEKLSAFGVHDVCRRTDGMLQGYALLRTQFSLNSSGGEGFQEILLRRSNSSTDAGASLQMAADAKLATPQAKQPLIDSNADLATLRLVKDSRGVRLVGDLVATLAPGTAIKATHDELGGKIAMSIEHDAERSKLNLVRLRDLDLSSGSELRAVFDSGETVKGHLPGLGVAAQLEAKPNARETNASELDAAWDAMVASMAAKPVRRPAEFVQFEHWDVTATPQFAAMKNGRVASEDIYDVASLLNRAALKGEDTSLVTLARAISAIAWRDGDEKTEGGTTELAYKARFGPAAAPSHRRVTLTMSNVFGSSIKRSLTVHSHGLVSIDALRQTKLVAALAGVNANDLKAPDASDAEAQFAPLASERGMLGQLLVRSARDGVLTPDELAAQVRVARKFMR